MSEEGDIQEGLCHHLVARRHGNSRLAGTPFVLLLQTGFAEANRTAYAAIEAEVKRRGGRLQSIEYGMAFTQGKPPDIRDVIDFWHPDGIITDCRGSSRTFPGKAFGRIPTVLLDAEDDATGSGPSCVVSDAAAIASAAASELLGMKCPHFAYVGWPGRPVWDRARAAAFRRLLGENGFPVAELTHPVWHGRGIPVDSASFARAVSRLPRPCGVFAANDMIAESFVSAAIRHGFSVPEDFAVVGVDNNEEFCENQVKSITSVEQDFRTAGRLAVELLADRMVNHACASRTARFGVGRVVRRASANGFPRLDSRVANGLEFIRRKACDGIGVDDVVAEMGCSRRLAFLRFREVGESSINKLIHRVRLEQAQRLLAEGRFSITDIALLCGYASDNDFRRVYRRTFGVSPKQAAKSTLHDLCVF